MTPETGPLPLTTMLVNMSFKPFVGLHCESSRPVNNQRQLVAFFSVSSPYFFGELHDYFGIGQHHFLVSIHQ